MEGLPLTHSIKHKVCNFCMCKLQFFTYEVARQHALNCSRPQVQVLVQTLV